MTRVDGGRHCAFLAMAPWKFHAAGTSSAADKDIYCPARSYSRVLAACTPYLVRSLGFPGPAREGVAEN
jgi:hypothetical protein